MKKYFATVALLFFVGCAEGEAQGPAGPDAATGADAAVGGFPDADTSYPDAQVGGFPDANASFPDASPVVSDGGGLPGMCTDNSQCTNAGECCYPLFQICGPGTVDPVFGCIPE